MASKLDIALGAERDVGYTERPAGSNDNKYSRRLGAGPRRWCADFVVCKVLEHGGVDLRRYSDNAAYTPNLFNDLKAKGWAIDERHAVPGDILFEGFAGGRAGIEHVEICRDNRYNGLNGQVDYITIGGNTSGGSNTNGGAVQKRGRRAEQVLGCIHIPDSILPNLPVGQPANPTPPVTAAALIAMADVVKALFYVRQIVVADGYPNPPEAVKFVQQGINNKHIPGLFLLVDGVWGPHTKDAVKWVQATNGLVADGVVGPATWHLLYG